MMNNSPLLTVYITNHNYGKYIDQAINSILEQSFQDFEIIIIDDGSTDNSKAIIDQYENHPKTKVIYQNNRGLTVSNNIALKLSRGEFIVRLDADDYFTKDALKLMVREFENNKLGMVFGDWYLVSEDGEILGVEQRHDFQKDVVLYDQPAHGACTMFRKSCLKQLGGYDETITRQDGYEVWLRFIEKYEVRNINVPIFYYRQHFDSLTKDEVRLLDTRSKILQNHANRQSDAVRPKVLAIIPIRGNELDHRSRPFEQVGGKLLIDRTIDVVSSSDGISKIIITTPDQKIIDHIAKHYSNFDDIIAHRRPVEMARINTPIQDTIDHVMDAVSPDEKFDYFFGFSIETPFKRKELIESGISLASIFNIDTVIGVRPNSKKHFKHNGAGLIPVEDNSEFLRLENRQIFTKASGYLLRSISSYMESRKMIGEKIGHVIFDQKAMFEIKSDIDIGIADYIENYSK
jgi:CMP-N-acetylneuraminic acid synthetase